ncbi:TetR/AcrR family transcriptional regulator [Enterococcus sp. LJL128]|uniref:TetR/AcrR family transcriptional regulator n=1 Tax=Enterococcus sp. LJL51 TaxID=3416656 RepID=UPI003CF76A56
MKTINQALILKTAEQLIEKHGMKKTSLSQVAKQLGVSHAALYKYFENKEDLWTSLAFGWLRDILADVLQFDSNGYESKLDLLHDWLWILTISKKRAYDSNKKMFTLYTTYIDNNPATLSEHTSELVATVSELLGYSNIEVLKSVLEVFAVFSAPSFANTWDINLHERFENVWNLIRPGLSELLN